MEISHLDDFKLEVEQQLYELDENDEDISYEGWLYLRYQKFDMKGIWKQPRMPIYLSKKIVVSPDV